MSVAQHVIVIAFVFALGACIGSFLNVVVWRLPLGMSLMSPPSHCPVCQTPLAIRDNIPIFGWPFLRGRCRYCGTEISIRYPLVELVTALLLVFFYVMFFFMHASPCAPDPIAISDLLGHVRYRPRMMSGFFDDWPMYGLFMFMVCALFAASLIDAERYEIELSIPWLMAVVGFIVHALVDRRNVPGAVNLDPGSIGGALAIGGMLGLIASIVLLRLGKMPLAFAQGEPALDVDTAEPEETRETALSRFFSRLLAKFRGEATPQQLEYRKQAQARHKEEPPPEAFPMPDPPLYTSALIRAEIRKEMLFLMPPMLGAILVAALVLYVRPVADLYHAWMRHDWVSGLLGSMLGALLGAMIVWLFRILGTYAFGRVAMGLGDVHLMFGIGAILGPGPVIITFFLAPFAALAFHLWKALTHGKRELPFGPYLSLAAAIVLLCYCPIADFLRPGLTALAQFLRQSIGV